MHYLDASCCVATLTREIGTARIGAWLEAHREEHLTISLWVDVEVASALSMKMRMGSLNEGERSDALSGWRVLKQSLRILEVTAREFGLAAQKLRRADLGLRAGDALHLAVASAYDCTLVTLVDRMAKAAPQLGIPVATL